MRLRSLTLALVTGGLVPAASHAAIVLYEPFNYGTSTVALSGVNGSATGLDGTTYATAGTTEYLPTGLTFSNLQVTGGTARIGYDSAEARNATRGINFNVSTGSLFGSMVYASGGAANNGISTLLLTTLASHGDTAARLDVAANEYDSPAGAQNIAGLRTFGQSTKATGTGMTGDGSVNYLFLFQVSNVGATSGSQTVDLWVLTEAQFNNFKSGGLQASVLNAATTGTAATQVLQRANHTNTGANGYFSLSDAHFMRLVSFRGNGSFDEIRLGTASLDEVTPVPEPASLAAIGLASLALRRRRR